MGLGVVDTPTLAEEKRKGKQYNLYFCYSQAKTSHLSHHTQLINTTHNLYYHL